MSNTLARLFRQAVSYDKPDMMLAKSEGRYRPISGCFTNYGGPASSPGIAARCWRRIAGSGPSPISP